MRPWHRKLLVDTAKMAIPFPRTLRRLKRRYIPYRTNDSNDSGLLADGLDQIRLLRQKMEIDGIEVVEFGSGWLPIIPFLWRIAGAKTIVLTDQERLLDRSLLRQAAAFIWGRADDVAATLGVTLDRVHDIVGPSLTAGGGIDEALACAGLHYVVPFAASKMRASSADIIVSRAVLEHVPPWVLENFMVEFWRILRPGGVMCHVIDMSDHWEHNDKSICRVNFLRYGESFWRMTGINCQNYQNRLRHPEYLAIVRASGFVVIGDEAKCDAATLECLAEIPLAARFKGIAKEELAILTGTIVARKSDLPPFGMVG